MRSRKKPIQTIRGLESKFCLDEYSNFMQEKYDAYCQFINLLMYPILIFAGKYTLPIGAGFLMEQLGIEKKMWQKTFYASLSSRYYNTVKYLENYAIHFVNKNCDDVSSNSFNIMNDFVDCVSTTIKMLDIYGTLDGYEPTVNKLRNQLRIELKEILGKMAWFSLKQPKVIALDPEFQKFYPHLLDYNIFHRLIDEVEVKELLNQFNELYFELDKYKSDFETRLKLNKGHLEGWTITVDDETRILFDKAALNTVSKSYKSIALPLGRALELTLLGVKGMVYQYFILNRYIKPKLNKYKEAQISKWSEKKEILLTNKKTLEELKAETKTEQEKTIWMKNIVFVSSAIISCSNAINASLFLCRGLYEMVNQLSADAQPEESLFDWSLIYEFLIFLYSTYSFVNLFYTRFANPGLDGILHKYKTQLNDATEKIRYENVKLYKGVTVSSSNFFLPVKDYKRLSAEKVDIVLKRVLTKHGHSIQCSNVDSIQHKKIALTINETADFHTLKKDVEQSLKFENQVEKLQEQLQSLSRCLKLSGKIASFSKENNEIIGEVIFSFMHEEDASQWKIFFSKHLPIHKIIHNKCRLELKLKLLKEENFSSLLKDISEHIHEINIVSKVKTGFPSLTLEEKKVIDTLKWNEIVKQINEEAKNKKKQLKNEKIEQRNEIAEQQEIAEQHRKKLESSKEVSLDPTIYYFDVNDGNDYTYPPKIKFSSELEEKAFHGNTRMYFHFFNRVENGFIKNVNTKDNVHNPKQIKVKDFETGKTFKPTRKVKGYGRLYGNVRAWAITTTEEINGHQYEVYDVRAVSMVSHPNK